MLHIHKWGKWTTRKVTEYFRGIRDPRLTWKEVSLMQYRTCIRCGVEKSRRIH